MFHWQSIFHQYVGYLNQLKLLMIFLCIVLQNSYIGQHYKHNLSKVFEEILCPFIKIRKPKQKKISKIGVIINEFDIQILYNFVVFRPPKWINFDANAIIMVCVISVNYCSDHTS